MGAFIRRPNIGRCYVLVLNPHAVPYTKKTSRITLALNLLKKISQASVDYSLTDLDNEIIPTKDFLSTDKNKEFGDRVAYWGSITVTESDIS